MEEENTPIVIDNGSGLCKAGFAGNDVAQTMFPTVVGQAETPRNESFVGDEAQVRRGMLSMSHPIERGVITDWDGMEKIWHHTFSNELHVSPKTHPLFMTDGPLNRRAHRQQMTQIMFETFNIPEFHVHIHDVLSIYASGRTTGIVIGSGDGVSHAIPVYDGLALPHATIRLELGGRDLTENLMKSLLEGGANDKMGIVTHIAGSIKENICYVSQDYQQELESSTVDSVYELPDGQSIAIGPKKFRVPEALFRPSLFNIEGEGIHQMTFRAIAQCDVTVQRELYRNIVLSGGNTLFPGFETRFKNELLTLVPTGTNPVVIAPPNRDTSAWIGASIISSMGTFRNQWITREGTMKRVLELFIVNAFKRLGIIRNGTGILIRLVPSSCFWDIIQST